MPKLPPIATPELLDQMYQGGAAIKVGAAAAPDVPSPSERRENEVIAGLRTDRCLRIIMALVMTVLFVALNWAVIHMIQHAVMLDDQRLAAKIITPEQSTITEKTYIALVGATAVQVAAAVLTIVRYLFPGSKNE